MRNPDARRASRRAWRSPIATVGIIGLVLASVWLIPIREAKLFLVELDARRTCHQLTPLVGSVTDRFELTDAWWLGGESESGYCVMAVNVTGRGAMAAVSETRFLHFLRDQAGVSQASISKAIVLKDRQGAGVR